MTFFEPPPPPPEPPPQPPRRPWHGAPDGALGRTLALDLVIGRAEQAAVWIPALTVYPDGFEFDVQIRHRLDDEQFEHPVFMGRQVQRRRARSAGEGLPPELLRLGIEFADCRKATNLGDRLYHRQLDPDSEPEGPILAPAGGGGGGGGRWHHGFYVWPLPPPGPLAFVCEWPAAGIELTRNEIDSEKLRTAAADAVVLWDNEGQSGSGHGFGMQYMHAVSHAPAPSALAKAREWLEQSRESLLQRLRDAGVAHCPACGDDRLELAPAPLQDEAETDEQRRPAVRFVCPACGHLLLFDAQTLGFRD